MTTYYIKNGDNQIIYESDNYLDTTNEYQRLKRIDNQFLTIITKSIFNRF